MITNRTLDDHYLSLSEAHTQPLNMHAHKEGWPTKSAREDIAFYKKRDRAYFQFP